MSSLEDSSFLVDENGFCISPYAPLPYYRAYSDESDSSYSEEEDDFYDSPAIDPLDKEEIYLSNKLDEQKIRNWKGGNPIHFQDFQKEEERLRKRLEEIQREKQEQLEMNARYRSERNRGIIFQEEEKEEKRLIVNMNQHQHQHQNQNHDSQKNSQNSFSRNGNHPLVSSQQKLSSNNSSNFSSGSRSSTFCRVVSPSQLPSSSYNHSQNRRIQENKTTSDPIHSSSSSSSFSIGNMEEIVKDYQSPEKMIYSDSKKEMKITREYAQKPKEIMEISDEEIEEFSEEERKREEEEEEEEDEEDDFEYY